MAGKGADGEGLSANLAGMSKNQLYDIMCQMKTLIEQNQQQARQILIQNPLLTKALFQAQIMLGMQSRLEALKSVEERCRPFSSRSLQLIATSSLIEDFNFGFSRSCEEYIATQEQEVASSGKKYGGLVPKKKKKPLISKDHERAFFDSADWALCKRDRQARNPDLLWRLTLHPLRLLCVTYVTGDGPDQPQPRMAFTGDALLIRGCGRTDFPGGSSEQLNAIKFTHEGKVGIKLYVVPAPSSGMGEGFNQKISADRSTFSVNTPEPDKCLSLSQIGCDWKGFHGQKNGECPYKNHTLDDEPKTPDRNGASMDGCEDEPTVWIRCDVYDTGIGIPENALPNLFKKYMQVGADTARKYGGTGLGLAICKQLVELMGGHLTVSSQEHIGSTFTFVIAYKVSPECDNSDDPDELSDMDDHNAPVDANDDDTSSGFFQFQPRTLGSLFSSNGSSRAQKLLPNNVAFNASHELNRLSEDPNSFMVSNIAPNELISLEDACSVVDGADMSFEHVTSMKHSPDSNKKVTVGGEVLYHKKENGQFHGASKEVGGTMKPRDSQEASEMRERCERSSQCTSSNSPENHKATLKPKILLVDDNKINVMVARSMMKQFGYCIDVVNNGVEAVRAVQCHGYDLILMDVCMPVMDGLQATRLIRSFEQTGNWDAAVKAGIELHMSPNSSPNDEEFNLPSRNKIRIIAMTANALAESAEECYANGMDSFVSKPVTFQKLKECLEQYLP
ncbi:hypothetical protein TEA_024065 [Camellia sinensis var. sinensis]|uniref:histidine kinase n=1 Tax=Camellia sinensis var. sinensis TaxID=542762 RepID=A0A4S4EBP2_CAMSN|nr:hypothetical protein TEA_024065 [Camellia sinensis var. sinensis]